MILDHRGEPIEQPKPVEQAPAPVPDKADPIRKLFAAPAGAFVRVWTTNQLLPQEMR